MPTLNDMCAALLKTWKDNSTYARTLCGPRTRGSTSQQGVFMLGNEEDPVLLAVEDREVTPVDGAAKGAQAYVCEIPEIGGRLGALKYGTLTPAERARVEARAGAHGPELVMPWKQDHPFPRAVLCTFIVGPDGNLWTWHPGPMMGPFNPEEGPQQDTAVKLV